MRARFGPTKPSLTPAIRPHSFWSCSAHHQERQPGSSLFYELALIECRLRHGHSCPGCTRCARPGNGKTFYCHFRFTTASHVDREAVHSSAAGEAWAGRTL